MIRVTVLTGFLGSGKTTLLRNLLSLPKYADSGVVINEFADIGVDQITVAPLIDHLALMEQGVLCCARPGMLAGTLKELLRSISSKTGGEVSRVFIELSGLAFPQEVYRSIYGDPELADVLSVDSIIAMFDATAGISALQQYRESVAQVAAADIVVVTKTAQATQKERATIQDEILGINTDAEIIELRTTSASTAEWAMLDNFMMLPNRRHHARELLLHHSHQHNRAVQQQCFVRRKEIGHEGFLFWASVIGMLDPLKVLRIKGVLNIDGQPHLVNAVQGMFDPPELIDAWPDNDRDSRFVIIHSGLTDAELTTIAASLEFRMDAPGLNPNNYELFLTLVHGQPSPVST